MNLKKLKLPFFILLTIIIIAGILFIPKIKKVLAIKEAMDLKNIEHTFINMSEHFPIKRVEKSENPFCVCTHKK
jgi:hypothetical protein